MKKQLAVEQKTQGIEAKKSLQLSSALNTFHFLMCIVTGCKLLSPLSGVATGDRSALQLRTS